MAKNLGTASLTVSSERRTWRVQVDCVKGQSPVLTAHRELLRSVDGAVISRDQNAGVVSRSLAQVAAQEIILADGTVITPAHIAEALAAYIELWEEEDVAPPATPDAAPQPAP